MRGIRSGSFKKTGERVLDILYPPRCPFCDRLLDTKETVCPVCREKLPYIKPPVCRKCGRPVIEGDVLCDDCLREDHVFDKGGALFLYNDMTREALTALKYKNRADIGRSLGRLLYDHKSGVLSEYGIDLIVPVPIHPSRRKKRGYNQADIIASAFSERAGFPIERNAVIRAKKTSALKEMDRAARQKAAGAAFEEGPAIDAVDGKRILIIDDIFTSGATIDGVSHVLKAGGARFAAFLTVCIGGTFMLKYN